MAKVQPNASAKPTAPKGEKEKKVKKERAAFAGVGSADPNVYPFSGRDVNGTLVATPEGFDWKANKPLKKKDFARPSLFIRHQAEKLEMLAKKTREKADEMVKLGDGAGANKANRLIKMMAKVDEIRATLAAQGIDVDALLKNTKPAEVAPAKTTA